MFNNERKYAHLSNINKDFEPLIPAVNIAFEKIWQYSDINEFRENWTRTRSSYPDFVPLEGLEVSHRTFPARDTTELEIRIWRPVATKGEKLPLLFVLHGGGMLQNQPKLSELTCFRICRRRPRFRKWNEPVRMCKKPDGCDQCWLPKVCL